MTFHTSTGPTLHTPKLVRTSEACKRGRAPATSTGLSVPPSPELATSTLSTRTGACIYRCVQPAPLVANAPCNSSANQTSMLLSSRILNEP